MGDTRERMRRRRLEEGKGDVDGGGGLDCENKLEVKRGKV